MGSVEANSKASEHRQESAEEKKRGRAAVEMEMEVWHEQVDDAEICD